VLVGENTQQGHRGHKELLLPGFNLLKQPWPAGYGAITNYPSHWFIDLAFCLYWPRVILAWLGDISWICGLYFCPPSAGRYQTPVP
jgi:hypothetical protein